MGIYEYIPDDRYITREELVSLTGLSDRMVRRMIQDIRKKPDTVIISSSSGKGYKRPSTIQELEICLAESRSRVQEEKLKQVAIIKRINTMSRRGPQPSLFGED